MMTMDDDDDRYIRNLVGYIMMTMDDDDERYTRTLED